MKKFLFTALIFSFVCIAFSANSNHLLVGNWKGVTASGAMSHMVFFPDGELLVIVVYSSGKKVSVQRRYTFVAGRIFVSSSTSVNAYVLKVISLSSDELIVQNETGQNLRYIKTRRR